MKMLTDERPDKPDCFLAEPKKTSVSAKLENNQLTLSIDISSLWGVALPDGKHWLPGMPIAAVDALTVSLQLEFDKYQRGLRYLARKDSILGSGFNEWVKKLHIPEGRGITAVVRAKDYKDIERWQVLSAGCHDLHGGDLSFDDDDDRRPVLMRGSRRALVTKCHYFDKKLFLRYLRAARYSCYDADKHEKNIYRFIKIFNRRDRDLKPKDFIQFSDTFVRRGTETSSYWHNGKHHHCEPLPLNENSSRRVVKRYRRWHLERIIEKGRQRFTVQQAEEKKQRAIALAALNKQRAIERRQRERELNRRREAELKRAKIKPPPNPPPPNHDQRLEQIRRSLQRRVGRKPTQTEKDAIDRAAWLLLRSEIITRDPKATSNSIVRLNNAARRAVRDFEGITGINVESVGRVTKRWKAAYDAVKELGIKI